MGELMNFWIFKLIFELMLTLEKLCDENLHISKSL